MKTIILIAGLVLQNSQFTPGDQFKVGIKEICKSGYSKKVRNVTAKQKKEVCFLYGKKDLCPKGYEIDHLIPLSLGGSNDNKNLWPQPRKEALQKDRLESKYHSLVCTKKLKLNDAQVFMRGDWRKEIP